MIDYLLKFIKCKVTVIVIQPKTLAFAAEPSKPVLNAVDSLAEILAKLIL